MVLLANHGRPWGGERVWNLFVVKIFCWWKCVEFGGSLERKLVACGGRKGFKEKGKRKRNYKGKIFSWTQKVKLLKRLIPGFESWMRKTFRKIPKSSRNQTSWNDSQKLPKIKNNILRLMVKFV